MHFAQQEVQMHPPPLPNSYTKNLNGAIFAKWGDYNDVINLKLIFPEKKIGEQPPC